MQHVFDLIVIRRAADKLYDVSLDTRVRITARTCARMYVATLAWVRPRRSPTRRQTTSTGGAGFVVGQLGHERIHDLLHLKSAVIVSRLQIADARVESIK